MLKAKTKMKLFIQSDLEGILLFKNVFAFENWDIMEIHYAFKYKLILFINIQTLDAPRLSHNNRLLI